MNLHWQHQNGAGNTGEGTRVAMIEHNGAPIELIEFTLKMQRLIFADVNNHNKK